MTLKIPEKNFMKKNINSFLYFTFVALALPVLAHKPPTAQEIVEAKRNGTYDEKMEFVHDLGHHEMAPELVAKAKKKITVAQMKANGEDEAAIEEAERNFALPSGFEALPSTGTPAILNLVIDFSDKRLSTLYPDISVSDINENILGSGTTEAGNHSPYESVSAFYDRASEGSLSFTGDTLGVYSFSGTQESYTPTSTSSTAENQQLFDMIVEALQSFDASHDFTQYDNDNDGDIDALNVIWVGDTGAWATFWWAYQWSFFTSDANSTTFDGKTLDRFTWQSLETRSGGSDFNPATLIHEVGHILGLPDLYDYEPGSGLEGGVGGLDIMDSRGNQNAFFRWTLDWITPEIVSSGATVTRDLRASGDTSSNTNKAVAIFPDLSNDPFQEFFMVENRHRIGNDGGDSNMPSDGLVIWHIDATLNNNQTGFAFNNTSGDHKLVRLIEADGLDEIENGSQANAGDYYNTGEVFDMSSNPASVNYAGDDTQVIVRNISADGVTMTADIGFEPIGPDPELVDGGSSNHSVSATSLEALQSLTIISNIVNGGTNASGDFKVRYYLSSDNSISGLNDTLLGEVDVPSITGEATATVNSTALSIPLEVGPGDYYLGWIIDADSEVAESNETNNTVLYNSGSTLISVTQPDATIDLADTGIVDHSTNLTIINVGSPQLAVYGNVINNGDGSSGGFDVSLVISSDTTIDSSDTVLSTKTYTSLVPGESTPLDFLNVTVPTSQATGMYYVGWLIDSGSAVTETDEVNNAVLYKNGTIQLEVQGVQNSIDLLDDGEAYHYVNALDYNIGEPISVDCDIRNVGTIASGDFTVTFVLSEDAIIEDSDYVIGAVDMTSIGAADWATCNLSNAPIPENLSTADYYLGWIIDKADNILELGEPDDYSNNYVLYRSGERVISITNPNPVIELRDAGTSYHHITTVTGDASTYSNELFSFGASITNTGNTPSGSFTVTAELMNNLFEEDAARGTIGSVIVPSILPGETVPFSFNDVAVPDTGTGGEHYIRWWIDSDGFAPALDNIPNGIVSEEDETNNTVFFRETNYTLDLLTPSDNIDITDAGVDTHNITRETWSIGESLVFDVSIFNDGTWCTDQIKTDDTIDYFTVHFFLSEDQNIDADEDILIESTGGLFLDANEVLQLDVTQFLTTSYTPPGDYYIGWILDVTGTINERDEDDNIVLINGGNTVITITNSGTNMDLQDNGNFTQSVSSTAVAGGLFDISHDVFNDGGDDSNGFDVYYYLSTDNDIDDTDYLIHTRSVPGGVSANTFTDVNNVGLTMPTGIPDGEYFVGWIIDPQNVVLETDETDNTVLYWDGLLKIDIDNPSNITDLADTGKADHTVSSNIASAGGTFSVSSKVENISTFPSSSCLISYYFSADNALDVNDYLIGSDTVPVLPSGGVANVGLSNVTLPFDIASGQYHVIWKIDPTNQVLETNEANNIALYEDGDQLIAVDVVIPDVDLADGGVNLHTISQDTIRTGAGNTFDISASLVNNGTVNSGPFDVKLYISTDTLTNVPDPGDLLLKTVSVADLAGGASLALNFNNIFIPTTHSTFSNDGSYYLGWIIDSKDASGNDAVEETNEGNNVAVFNNGFTQLNVVSDMDFCYEKTTTGYDLIFVTSASNTYTVFTSTDLNNTSPWTALSINGNTVINGDGSIKTISILNSLYPPVNGKRFYYVQEN